MSKKHNRIPAIMYHSIGITDHQWHWNFLTCPYKVFEDQLKWLKKFNYKTIIFEDIYNYVIHEKPIPKKSVFLTFDDGYLDNYVFAYPLLKKYGMRGTIFVNPDFVDPSNHLRPIYNENLKKNELDNLEKIGFCNWAELKKIDKEGVLDVQSHAKTHTWYPISDKIIDFRHPQDNYIWMDWNRYPDKKPYLQNINPDLVKYGVPVFEHEKALSSKRVFINESFNENICQYVHKKGKNFFNQNGWKNELLNFANALSEDINIVEKEESKEEYEERIRYELSYTKNIMEEKLDKEVNYLCWPGGSATKIGVKIADDLGYLMSSAARDLSGAERKKIPNSPDLKINRIARITPKMFSNWKWKDPNTKIIYSPGWYFIFQLWSYRRKYLAQYWFKVLVVLNYKLR